MENRGVAPTPSTSGGATGSSSGSGTTVAPTTSAPQTTTDPQTGVTTTTPTGGLPVTGLDVAPVDRRAGDADHRAARDAPFPGARLGRLAPDVRPAIGLSRGPEGRSDARPDRAARRFEVAREGVVLRGEQTRSDSPAASGPPIVLLHGLTATRRYVLMGSSLLERRGYRLVSYDARGHGESSPAPDPADYQYSTLVDDLAVVLDDLEIERAVLAGSSMGAATALAFALRSPDRVVAIVQSTPAYAGRPHDDPEERRAWEALAVGLERAGVDGFMDAFQPSGQERWQDSVRRLTRQRLERHRNPEGVAAALRIVPRSEPFSRLDELERIEAPTLVVASRDEADPEHPLEVAEQYVERLPNAELAVEAEGKSPLAWRGAQLSRTIADFLQRRVPELARAAGAVRKPKP